MMYFAVSQEKNRETTTINVNDACVLSNKEHLELTQSISCGNSETFSADISNNNLSKKPKSGVIRKILRRLLQSRL